MDPQAVSFIQLFLSGRDATLATLTALGAGDASIAAAATALSAITADQWSLLQLYLFGSAAMPTLPAVLPTWGKMVMSGFLSGGGGGLVVTQTVNNWLHGGWVHSGGCVLCLTH